MGWLPSVQLGFQSRSDRTWNSFSLVACWAFTSCCFSLQVQLFDSWDTRVFPLIFLLVLAYSKHLRESKVLNLCFPAQNEEYRVSPPFPLLDNVFEKTEPDSVQLWLLAAQSLTLRHIFECFGGTKSKYILICSWWQWWLLYIKLFKFTNIKKPKNLSAITWPSATP